MDNKLIQTYYGPAAIKWGSWLRSKPVERELFCVGLLKVDAENNQDFLEGTAKFHSRSPLRIIDILIWKSLWRRIKG